MAEWLVDIIANRHNQTYVKGFIDISGSDGSGNALTVRNGNLSLPNNSISSSAVVREVMLLTSTGSGSSVKIGDLEWDIYGSVNMLANPQVMRSYGTGSQVYNGNHTVSALSMLFNPGVYKITMSGGRGGETDEMAFGFDLNNNGLIGYMTGSEEQAGALTLGSSYETVTHTATFIVPHVANFHWVERQYNTWQDYNQKRVQVIFERIGSIPFSGTDDTLDSYANIPSNAQRDIAGGIYWSSTVTKPTDPDEYLDLDDTGNSWIYKIS
jgi:hypothetical protein